jgi:hypothetical protein
MLWNSIIHIVAGIFGSNIFNFQFPGIVYPFLLASAVQVFSVTQFHSKIKSSNPESIAIQGNVYFYKIAQLYIFRIIFYGSITLAAAYFAR